MNISSNRPTAVSRLIWDADLEPRNNYVIKGDLVGRLARYCGLTMSSDSGVVSSTFPSFSLYVGEASGYNGTIKETLTTSFTVSLASFVESLSEPVISSDGTNIYYPDISEGLFLDISYSVKCTYVYPFSGSNTNAVDYTAKFEFLDSNGLVVYTDTKTGSGKTPGGQSYGATTSTLYTDTFKFPLLRSVSSVRVTFTAGTWRSSQGAYNRPELHCSGVNIYFSGV